MQDHANLTGHVLLGVLDERVERLGCRGEPLRVVDQLAPALVDVALDAVLFAFEAAVLEFLMRGDQGHGARRLVQLAGLDADQAVLDEVDAADALGSGAAVHLFDGLQRGDVTSVDLDRHTFLELDDDFIFDRREGRVVGVGVAVLDQRVDAFVHGVGLEGLHAIFVGELVTGVDHVGFNGTAGEGALLDGLKAFTTLADIEGHGHDVLAGALLQVRDGDGGVKTAGVGQNNALVICHWFPFVQGLKNKLMQVYTEDCIFMHGVLVIWKRGLAASRSGRRRCRHWCKSP